MMQSTCDSPQQCSTSSCSSDTSLEIDESKLSWGARMIRKGFYQGLEVCFNDLEDEPKKILMVGGCRQREFARRLGFLLPFTTIYTLDPDYHHYKLAQEEIKCRFKFVHSQVEKLGLFSDKSIDFTIAHNIFEYTTDWEQSLHQLCRVSKKNLLISTQPTNLVHRVLEKHGSLNEALESLGCKDQAQQPNESEILQILNQYGTAASKVNPFPWTMWMYQLNP